MAPMFLINIHSFMLLCICFVSPCAPCSTARDMMPSGKDFSTSFQRLLHWPLVWPPMTSSAIIRSQHMSQMQHCALTCWAAAASPVLNSSSPAPGQLCQSYVWSQVSPWHDLTSLYALAAWCQPTCWPLGWHLCGHIIQRHCQES